MPLPLALAMRAAPPRDWLHFRPQTGAGVAAAVRWPEVGDVEVERRVAGGDEVVSFGGARVAADVAGVAVDLEAGGAGR